VGLVGGTGSCSAAFPLAARCSIFCTRPKPGDSSKLAPQPIDGRGHAAERSPVVARRGRGEVASWAALVQHVLPTQWPQRWLAKLLHGTRYMAGAAFMTSLSIVRRGVCF
jgi:hypothetical protein